MSRGQAPARHAEAHDVRTRDVSRSTAMPRPQGLPTHHIITHLTTTNLTSIDNPDNNYNSNRTFNNTVDLATTYIDRYLSVDWTTSGRTSEDYSKLREEFYQSYNPQIGIHTAAVLGGILGWLIVYLVYKTKVKKWVLDLAKRKCLKRQQKDAFDVFAEFEENELNPQLFQCPHMDTHIQHLLQQRLWHLDHLGQNTDFDSHLQDCPFHHPLEMCFKDQDLYFQPHHRGSLFQAEDSVCGKHRSSMPNIVIETYSSVPPTSTLPDPYSQDQNSLEEEENGVSSHPHTQKSLGKSGKQEKGKPEKEKKKKKYRRKRSRSRGRQCPAVTVVDVEELDTKRLLPPPCSQSDSAQATARWVQNIPLLMQSYQDINGLMLKAQPDMMGSRKQTSCPLISTALSYAALPLLGLPNLGWNNSMPHLAENGLSSIKGSDGFVVPMDKNDVSLDDKEVQLLQTAPCCVPRSKSTLSHPEVLLRPQNAHTLPLPSLRSCQSSQPVMTAQSPGQMSSSVTTLAVPGSGMLRTSCHNSVPSSPVPVPFTPTVTIQNRTSRVGRAHGRSLHRHESEDSVSSSSSFDPLIHLQPECFCRDQEQPQQQQLRHQDQQQLHYQGQQQTHQNQPLDKQASLAFINDDADHYSGDGRSACSGQNSYHSDISSPSLRHSCNSDAQDNVRLDPNDAVATLETKL